MKIQRYGWLIVLLQIFTVVPQPAGACAAGTAC